MTTSFVPRTNTPRPPLPIDEYNAHLQDDTSAQPVKFQIILREGQEIVVGRIKVPTPTGHAFILRRFDTGAISLSTMFRACFPTASEEAEKAETTWVKNNYDTAGSNGNGRLRLAGTWIPPALALHIALDYNLFHILPALADAVPEPKAVYRKSGKQSGQGTSPPQAASLQGHDSAQAVNGITAPSLIPTSLPPTTPKAPSTRGSKQTPKEKASSPARPTKRSRKSASPAPSLVPKPTPTKVRSSPRRPPKVQEEEEPDVPGPDPEDDIAEAQEDVRRIKAEFAAAKAAQSTDDDGLVPITPAKKRNIEDTATPPHRFDLAKIEQGAMEVVPHRPVVNLRRLEPTQKAAAWGGLAFLVGLGASAVLPALLQGGTFGLW